MARILIAYGTRQGHTAQITDRIAQAIRSACNDVEVCNLSGRDAAPLAAAYDAVIVGASVHAGGYEREVRKWVSAHLEEINARPNAFYSVCLTSAGHDDAHDTKVDTMVDRFVTETGWRPQRVARFAGALVYSKYNWFLRRLMRRIVRNEEHGRFTDMSRDYDLTDYDQVDAFAHEFADCVAAPARST